MRIAFFGTPEFAVPSLRALIGEGFDIVAVVTQPDRPRGRSRSRQHPSPVKVVALEEELDLLQPENPNTPEFLRAFDAEACDIGVVVAYGHILKRPILEIPRLGMVNVHASLLPRYRGAAPIQYALLDGVDETGVSIMQMDEGMDTGPVLHQVATPVAADETFGELSARLAEIGALALVEALTLIGVGQATPVPQDDAQHSRAPKITRETARIQWDRPAGQIGRHIRAMDPAPGAWTEHDGLEIKCFGPTVVEGDGPPGSILRIEPGVVVASGEGAVEVLDVQPAGKKRMEATAWARGRRLSPGDRMG